MSDDSTRARVVDAAVACILDEGFYRASSNKIAKPRRRDVGCHPVPLRHPRGAACSRCTSAASTSSIGALADAVIAGDTRRERGSGRFVDALWAYYRRPEFLAYMQVRAQPQPRPDHRRLHRGRAEDRSHDRVGERLPALARAVLGAEPSDARGRTRPAASSTTSCAGSRSTRSSSRRCRSSTRAAAAFDAQRDELVRVLAASLPH